MAETEKSGCLDFIVGSILVIAFIVVITSWGIWIVWRLDRIEGQ